MTQTALQLTPAKPARVSRSLVTAAREAVIDTNSVDAEVIAAFLRSEYRQYADVTAELVEDILRGEAGVHA